MSSTVSITLDTAAPGGVAIVLAAGVPIVSVFDVVAAISTTDTDSTGYQMKLYGDVDDAHAPAEYRTLEADAPWISLAASKNIRLTAGDGVKTVRVKVRDDVFNPSGEATDTITVDTSVPVITVSSGPNPGRISKQTGKRTSSFSWSSDKALMAYEVRLVPAADSLRGAGTLIAATNGSQNVSGGATGAATPVTTQIDGSDLETAGVNGNAAYNGAVGIVKAFGQEAANGVWSV